MPLVCVVIADLTVPPKLAENDMLVDEYDQYPNEKTDVVVVSRSGSEEPEPAPSAADRMFFLSSLSPLLRPGTPHATSDGAQRSSMDDAGCERWNLDRARTCILAASPLRPVVYVKLADQGTVNLRCGDDGACSPPNP